MSTRTRARARAHPRPRRVIEEPIVHLWTVVASSTAPAPFARAGGLVVHGESTLGREKVAELWWPIDPDLAFDCHAVEALIVGTLNGLLEEIAVTAVAALDEPV